MANERGSYNTSVTPRLFTRVRGCNFRHKNVFSACEAAKRSFNRNIGSYSTQLMAMRSSLASRANIGLQSHKSSHPRSFKLSLTSVNPQPHHSLHPADLDVEPRQVRAENTRNTMGHDP